MDNINTYLMDMDVDVRSLESVSHKDAKYKSFKLEVSKDDYNKLFSEDAWPNGICVKQYISKRKVLIPQKKFQIPVKPNYGQIVSCFV